MWVSLAQHLVIPAQGQAGFTVGGKAQVQLNQVLRHIPRPLHQQQVPPGGGRLCGQRFGSIQQNARYADVILRVGAVAGHAYALAIPSQAVLVQNHRHKADGLRRSHANKRIAHIRVAAMLRHGAPCGAQSFGAEGQRVHLHAQIRCGLLHFTHSIHTVCIKFAADIKGLSVAVFLHGAVVGVYRIRRAVLQAAQKGLQSIGVKPVIAVQRAKVPPGGQLYCGIQRGAVPAVHLAHQPETAGVCLHKGLRQRGGAIGGAIINNDHIQQRLQAFIRHQAGFKRFLQRGSAVIGGNRNRQQLFHQVSPASIART